MSDYLYIVVSYPKDDRSFVRPPCVESVWSTAPLAEAAVRYYESIHPENRHTIIERPLNAMVKGE